jgi:class 3 adenylate cyclase
VGVQQLVRELGQARARLRVRSVIATTARAGGAWVNGLGRGMCATTGCAEAQADHGAAGARCGLKLDRG